MKVTIVSIGFLSCAMLAGCASTVQGSAEDVAALNPFITERIDAQLKRPKQSFPKLADTPTVRPSKLSDEERALFERGLVSKRIGVVADLQSAKAMIEAERASTYPIGNDAGSETTTDLESAALSISSQLAADYDAAKNVQEAPAPKLGGLPPRDQRD